MDYVKGFKMSTKANCAHLVSDEVSSAVAGQELFSKRETESTVYVQQVLATISQARNAADFTSCGCVQPHCYVNKPFTRRCAIY
jgi:hypothetical protein